MPTYNYTYSYSYVSQLIKKGIITFLPSGVVSLLDTGDDIVVNELNIPVGETA